MQIQERGNYHWL